MKKIVFLFSVISLLFTFSSCQEGLDNWNSETYEYSGRFVFKLMSEDMSVTYVDYPDSEIQLYNTAENVVNNVWIDDHGGVFPLKSKFEFSGDASAFKSVTEDFEQLPENLLSTEDVPSEAPTAVGQTFTEEEQWYIKATILEGKILPDAATSIGGNMADSLYLKIRLYSGAATFTSYEISEALRADPNVPEFEWRFTSAVPNPEMEETYVIGGYRYTGMPED
ncbi:MAG: hypothetical protein ITF98_00305 [Fermentimonas sp.]|nr:hypothetical protein [Fermentimonas sp.]